MQLFVTGCGKDDPLIGEDIDYRQKMREFVMDLGTYAKSYDSNFLIIPQNGQELLTNNGEGNGKVQISYIESIDATGRESMFYGYYTDDEETPEEDKQHLLDLCLLCEQYNVKVLATDYCFSQSKMDNSYLLNEQNGFISFAADERELDNIPAYPLIPHNENSDNVTKITQAKNFLYLINSENFATKQDFIDAVSSTNYDMLIIDLFHNETAYSSTEIARLKTKQNGGDRLVICYLSIGEAEDYRYYWQASWKIDKPDWLEPENPEWEGNYKVKYWITEWQDIIFGNDSSYLKMILDAGFDGAYLDIIDGFEYFEDK
jgi:cysteinyl-tRNA synthetase